MKEAMLGLAFFILLLGVYTVANAEEKKPYDMYTTYIVQEGDTLYEIATMYHVDLYHLIHENPHIFNPHWIYPKDEIKIPSPTLNGEYFKHN